MHDAFAAKMCEVREEHGSHGLFSSTCHGKLRIRAAGQEGQKYPNYAKASSPLILDTLYRYHDLMVLQLVGWGFAST
jgi:hypothetical protein